MTHAAPVRLAATIVLALVGPLNSAAKADNLKIVASIKPVQGIVSAVMAGVGEPVLLVDGNASPHGYTLKPSQARALQDSDLIFWIGPSLETFLEKPLATIAAQVEAVSLIDGENVRTLPFRELEQIGDTEDHDHDHDHDHDAKSVDPHIWLDPRNAAAMANMIAAKLSEKDPANAENYKLNAEKFASDSNALAAELESTLAPVRSKHYLVFHDAYHYFEDRFGMHPAGAVSIDPERTPGAAHLSALKDIISGKDVECLLVESQFPTALATSLTEGTDVNVATIDPLGASTEAGPTHYFKMMEAISQTMAECLSGASGQ